MQKGLRNIFTLLLVTLVISAISGCGMAENYGRLSRQDGGNRLTPEDLAQTWDRYNVYYAGYSPENPFAIIFDPREGDKILHVHRFWSPVKDEKTLREVMKWLGVRKERDPYIYRILSPKGDFYGYMYTGLSHVTIKVIATTRSLWTRSRCPRITRRERGMPPSVGERERR
jgi:hypothetical protein